MKEVSMTALDTRVSTLEQAIKKLQQQVNEIAGKVDMPAKQLPKSPR